LGLLALSLVPAHVPLWVAWFATVSLVGACVVREDNGLAPLLRLRPLALIGTVSYGMYLLNSLSVHLVQLACRQIGLLFPPAIFPIGLGVTVGAAYLSYQYFEKPFLRLKTHFSRLKSSGS